MEKIIYITESDINRIVKKIINEDDYKNTTKIEFQHKRNPRLNFSILVDNDNRIVDIEDVNVRFPFKIGQRLYRNIEVWACNNLFKIDGKDTCPEEKVAGIKVSDIPKGHILRMMYPSKFK